MPLSIPTRRVPLALLLWLSLAVWTLPSQAQQAGDVALVGLQADNPDAFAFVVLAPLSAGTEIHFTDNGWRDDGTFRANEGTYTYTVPAAGLTAGTVVRIDEPTGPAFATAGDQLLVYTGTEDNPVFLYALNVEGNAVWQETASSSNTSALPPGLVNGSTAVAVEELDNVAYTGPTEGTKAEILAAIGTAVNWTGDDDAPVDFATAFTVQDGGGNQAPFFTAVLDDATVAVGEAFRFTYGATDPDGEALTFTLVGGPSGSLLGASSGVFEWTPTLGDAGQSFVVEVAVSDGSAAQTTAASLTVLDPNVNQPPVLAERDVGLLVDASTTLRYLPMVEDPDGDVLTYSLVDGPAGASVAADTGELNWPGASEPGIFRFVMRASDGEDVLTYTLHAGVRGTLFAGLSGVALRTALADAYAPDQTLGYTDGRDTLYAVVEARQGVVSGVYTGYAVTLDPREDPSAFLANHDINAEHIWPQSMGAAAEPQRSDMHILYPARAPVNGARGNLPYAEIPDETATGWYYIDQTRSTPPETGRDAWSERTASAFEPREVVKGDVARGLLYFATVWDAAANIGFFEPQVSTLVSWDQSDPATGDEARRSGLIAQYQGNVNPYVLDASLAARAFLGSTGVEEAPAAGFTLSAAYPNPAAGAAALTLTLDRPERVRAGVYDVLGREVALLADGLLSGGVTYRLRVDGTDFPGGVYFVRVITPQGAMTRRVVLVR